MRRCASRRRALDAGVASAFRRARCARDSARIACAPDAPLAPFTTFRVGGPADWLLETRTADEIVDALQLAHASGVPVTLLGGGSNVLVADRGVRGLVIRPRGGEIEQLDREHVRADAAVDDQRPRALDDSCAASPVWKRGRARPARSAARFSATRISAAG